MEKREEIKNIYPNYQKFGEYIVEYSDLTKMNYCSGDDKEILILGIAADLRENAPENILQDIIENCFSIHNVVKYEYYRGEKTYEFVIHSALYNYSVHFERMIESRIRECQLFSCERMKKYFDNNLKISH